MEWAWLRVPPAGVGQLGARSELGGWRVEAGGGPGGRGEGGECGSYVVEWAVCASVWRVWAQQAGRKVARGGAKKMAKRAPLGCLSWLRVSR